MSPADPATSTDDAGRPIRDHTDRPPAWTILRSMLIGTVALLAGWYLAQWIFSWLGRPPEPVAYFCTIILTFLLTGSIGSIFARVTGRLQDDPRRAGKDLLDALDRISHGDFSARVRQTPHSPMSEVVESVNKMAGELGTLEQRRQEFISNVSHEIQSPLTSISGFASILRDDSLDLQSRHHYIDVISIEARRLSTLSDNLLRLSALDDDVQLLTTLFRVDEQVSDVVATLEPQWADKTIAVHLEASPLTIDADEDMLRQVWTNLVGNAIKYTPASGTVWITLSRHPSEEDHIQCQIRDTGIGIAHNDLPRIFERFFRADKARSGEGNGLGLPLAKRIVELHGGRIEASSQIGVGTTMTVTLPTSHLTSR